jgi:hypothetical protein
VEKNPAVPVFSPDLLMIASQRGHRADVLKRAFQADPDGALDQCVLFGANDPVTVLKSIEDLFTALPFAVRSRDEQSVREMLLQVARSIPIEESQTQQWRGDRYCTYMEYFNKLAWEKGTRFAGWLPFERKWQERLVRGEDSGVVRREIVHQYIESGQQWDKLIDYVTPNLPKKFWSHIQNHDPVLKPFADWILSQNPSAQEFMMKKMASTRAYHANTWSDGLDPVSLAAHMGRYYERNVNRTRAQIEPWLDFMAAQAEQNNLHDDLIPLIENIRVSRYSEESIHQLRTSFQRISDVGTFVSNAVDPQRRGAPAAPSIIAVNPDRMEPEHPFHPNLIAHRPG